MNLTTNILLSAMMMVESGGNPLAVNQKEDAVGPLQIRPIMLEDINRILSSDLYTLDDRYSVILSFQMAELFFTHYTTHHKLYTGEDTTPEMLARWWNGGYQGWLNNPSATDAYWEKVKKQIEKFMEVE